MKDMLKTNVLNQLYANARISKWLSSTVLVVLFVLLKEISYMNIYEGLCELYAFHGAKMSGK